MANTREDKKEQRTNPTFFFPSIWSVAMYVYTILAAGFQFFSHKPIMSLWVARQMAASSRKYSTRFC